MRSEHTYVDADGRVIKPSPGASPPGVAWKSDEYDSNVSENNQSDIVADLDFDNE